MRRPSCLILLVLCLFLGSALAAQTINGYYRFPTLHHDTIVFAAEGDLWRVSTGGGSAQRLTSHPGPETNPAISHDGQWLAFTGQYEGQLEVYVMPLAGGLPKRLTYEGEGSGCQVRGWTADGKVLYSTRHYSTLPNAQLVAIDPKNLQREWIRLAQADEVVYDDTGADMFFTRLSAQSSHAKRYKGGTAQQLWRWGRDLPEAVPLTTDYEGTSRWPMWWQGRVFFASDRDGTMNLWSMTPDGKNLKQLTQHSDFGVKNPSLSRGRIAYQNGADVFLLDLVTGKTAAVAISLTSDFDHMREKWITKPFDYISHVALSPTGDRVALTVRGQVFVAPASTGRLVQVTRQSDVRYREANFAGDGKSLLVLSDESGEIEFWRIPANGIGARTQLTRNGDTLRVQGFPSPDGKWVVSAERSQELLLFNLETAEKRSVATSSQRSFDSPQVAWSPDSQWIAFTNDHANGFSVIHLYSLATRKATAVTSERTPSFSPAWSPDGKWLYFLSERTLNSIVQAPWGLRQPEPFFDKSVKIYQLALSEATRRSPFQPDDELSNLPAPETRKAAPTKSSKSTPPPAPKSDKSDDTTKPKDDSTPKDDPKPKEDPKEKAEPRENDTAIAGAKEPAKEPEVTGTTKAGATLPRRVARTIVQLDGITRRLWEVPVSAGNYSRLEVGEKALFFVERDRGTDAASRLRAVEIKNRDIEVVTVLENVSMYRISNDAKKLLVRRTANLYVIDAAARAAGSLDKARVNLDALKFAFQPRDSWKQMFTDAWRLHRDYFYDKGMHGIDWRANLAKHLPLVSRITDREELNDALAYMMSELSALHTAVAPGDTRSGPDDEYIGIASLGARLVRDDAAGGYRIADIYSGDPDYPDRLSPLQRPGLRVAEGDVIESVNGVPTLSVPDIGALLRNQGNRQVLLRIKPGNPAVSATAAAATPALTGGTNGNADTSGNSGSASGSATSASPAEPASDPKLSDEHPAYEAIVTPITAGEATSLRYTDWELSRRRRVEQKGSGQIGYVHLRAMGTSDYAQWARDFYPIIDRPALILDLRHNRGGNIESWLLSRLMRKPWMWWTSRTGDPYPNMQNPFRGHLVVLVNEWTASDGETMANGVRRLGLGTIIGTRTWGGGIWLRSGMTRLVDRGYISAAENGSFVPDEGWVVEGPGITPDLIVDNLPAATFRGEDAQLDAAIAKLKDLLAKDPRPMPRPPAPVILKKP